MALLIGMISWLSFSRYSLAETRCTPGQASVIGTEYVATACPWESSVYTYRGIDLICQNGSVTRDPNSSGDTSYGNLTPQSFQNMLVSQAQYFGMKVFRNGEGTRFLLVTKYFGNGGSIDGKSVTSYPAAPAVNTDVFSKVIYVDPVLKPPCCLKIKNLTSDKASITPSAGERVTFSGSIFANYPVTWNLSIVDRLFSGNGTTATATWDGNNAAGTIVVGGTYPASLTAQTIEMACTDSASINVTVKNDTCVDNDGDGYFGMSSNCPAGDDCNDNDAAIHPGAIELCDGKDNNCNGQTDEGLSSDADRDGHYAIDSCKAPNDDCNDNDPTVYPNAPEICNDLKDNNCNGQVDESCKRNRCMEVKM